VSCLALAKFLLVKEREGFIVRFELSLNERIDQFDAAALGRGAPKDSFCSLDCSWPSLWSGLDEPDETCAFLPLGEC